MGWVYSFAVYNGELYVGGTLTSAGGNAANYIAKWNGTNWSAVGNGMDSTIYALAVYNYELYAGGDFVTADGNPANHIAKWNGTNWSALGAGTDTTVRALAVYNGDLYVGGDFQNAGGNSAKFIAKWNNPIGIKENFSGDEIRIYPNPTNSIVNLELNSGNATLTIMDVFGRDLRQQTLTKQQSTIDVNDLPSGIYFAHVRTQAGVSTKKIIVQH